MPKIGRVSRNGFQSIVLICLPTVLFALKGSALPEKAGPVESTMAYELLMIENDVRQVSSNAEGLLRAVLDNATEAAFRAHRDPQTRDEAIAVLEAIQLALVQHNFLQPPTEADWTQTLGIAFTPREFASGGLEGALSYPRNTRRVPYIDREKPFYFVDCDMGSQIFMAVGQRAGWDIRLVELPQHNFVRWHLSDALSVNWDWTRWESTDDDTYRREFSVSDDPRMRPLYLRSLESSEARAYYVALIASEALRDTDAERLFQSAFEVLPNHPLILNNFAWLYATSPELSKTKSGLAVSWSLAAWSTRPYDGNYADTVACALAADGLGSIAEPTEEFAIRHARSIEQRRSFTTNLEHIRSGELCDP